MNFDMSNKTKKILISFLVFAITFVNYGLPLKVIASESNSIFKFNLFHKNEIELNAYFDDELSQNEMIVDVNNTAVLTLEVSPLIEGYLKSGVLKFDMANGNENNFKIKNVTIEEKAIHDWDSVDELLLEEVSDDESKENSKKEFKNVVVTENNPQNMNDNDSESYLNNPFANLINNTAIKNLNSEEDKDYVEEDKLVVDGNKSVLNEISEESVVDLNGEEIAKQCYEASQLSENEIQLKNIIDPTKIFVEIAYKQFEQINPEDLFGSIKIVLEGNYINKNLETIELTRTENILLGWEYNKEIEITSEFAKVSPFTVGKNSGTIIENIVTVKRNIEDNNFLPIKQTNIKIEIPKIDNKLPIAVNVSANKLMATLGKELTGKEFTQNNWTYDKETGILEIKVSNESMLAGKGEDKFDIICRYEDYIEESNIKLNKNLKVQVEEYSSNQNKIQEKFIEEEIEKTVIPGELISCLSVEAEEKIGKGKINANYYIEDGEETKFVSTVKVAVLTSDILEEIKIEPVKEIYKLRDGSKLDATRDVMYDGVNFNYAEIKEMLEKGSTIDLMDENDVVFHTISKDTPESSIIFSEKINTVKVRINKVQVNGNMRIEFVKSIVRSEYLPAEFAMVTDIENTLKASLKYIGFEDVFQLSEIVTKNQFIDSITNVNFTMNKTHLSTITENENVEFKIDLINNLEISDLYKNPTFEIVFPTYVKEVKINDIYALYQNGLEVANYFVFEENGFIKLRIETAGTQAGFNFSNITNGTNIILNTNIVVDEITPQKQDEIRLYYYNEAVTNYHAQSNWSISKTIPKGIIKDTNGYDAITFEYQTPIGLVTINSITNFDETGRTVKSINQGEKIERIAIKDKSHKATMELSVLNNTQSNCVETILLGRIPFEGNKDVVTNEDLGTNVDTYMKSLIIPDQLNSNSATIYYSSNPNADKDLYKDENGWGKSLAPVENIKSFLIVVDGIFEPGAILKYKYDFEIPANLGYEVNMVGSFGTFYNEVSDELSKYETSVADKVGLITEAGAKYEASMTVDIGEGTEIGEARYLRYKVKVENTGSIDFEKVTIVNKQPKYGEIWTKAENDRYSDAGYVDSGKIEMKYELGELKAGETKEQEILIKTTTMPNNLVEYASSIKGIVYEKETDSYYIIDENNQKVYITEMPKEFFIENYATVYVDGTVNGITTNTVKNKLVDSNFETETAVVLDKNPIGSSDDMEYRIRIENISEKDLNNVVIEDVLPKELKFKKLTGFIEGENNEGREYEYDEKSNTLRLKIDKMEKDGIESFIIFCNISNMKNIGTATLENFITIRADGEIKEQGSVTKFIAVGPELTATQETNLENNSVLEGEEFDIIINVNNRGNGDSKGIKFNVTIPEELTIKKVTSEGKRQITNTYIDNIIEGNLYLLGAHDTASLVIRVKSKPLNEGETNRILNINTSVFEEYIGSLEINPLALAILDNPDRELTDEEKKEEEESSTIVNPTVPEDIAPKPEKTEKPTDDEVDNNQITQDELKEEIKEESEQEEINTENEEISQEIEKFKISGQVWKDENKDNSKNVKEEGISKIQVSLYEGDMKLKTSITDSIGKYRFTEVPAGNYTVVFNYEGSNYIASKYKAVNATENQNSDAIESEEGVAVTDIIKIANSDVQIDLGLQDRDEFDMAVHKYIVKSVVNRKGKETVETYDNKQLAKLEIRSKELKNTTIELEYKIVITNEGTVSGTVGMIKDYLPEALTFDTNVNTEWKQGADNVLYNESLKNVVIKPGESRELKLILSKVMTEDNTGTISNKVELSNVSTERTLKENLYNNIATQETIITISTGRTVSKILIILLLIMCTVIIYGIKTGKIKRTYK